MRRNNLADLELRSINARKIERQIATVLIERLNGTPAVVFLAPRQVGKTSLTRMIGEQRPSLYLSLESYAD
ncbi:MAG: putative ATPase [Bradyrhizobium sp.]|nr:putative ATPase [Bradyrhizobium sp.]